MKRNPEKILNSLTEHSSDLAYKFERLYLSLIHIYTRRQIRGRVDKALRGEPTEEELRERLRGARVDLYIRCLLYTSRCV